MTSFPNGICSDSFPLAPPPKALLAKSHRRGMERADLPGWGRGLSVNLVILPTGVVCTWIVTAREGCRHRVTMPFLEAALGW